MDFKKTIEIIKLGIDEKVYPCAAISIGSKNGELLRAWMGKKDLFPNEESLSEDTLFDIASLSKVVSTTMIALKFLEEKRIYLDNKIGEYFTVPKDKENITLFDLMTHTSGLMPHMDIQSNTNNPRDAVKIILNSKLVATPKTQTYYSCLGYILLGKVLEIVEGDTLDEIGKKYVFNPLDMKNTSYNPRGGDIASTEYDPVGRRYIKGIVHDENSRFLNGISGNAGVFSNIEDMSKFACMIANKGIYKNNKYLSANMFEKAITNYTLGMDEHRGLGFDLCIKGKSSCGDFFSQGSYGHTGFTGTSLWIDLKTGLNVVFLTNRVHFGRENTKIINFRKKLHNTIYNEMFKS